MQYHGLRGSPAELLGWATVGAWQPSAALLPLSAHSRACVYLSKMRSLHVIYVFCLCVELHK